VTDGEPATNSNQRPLRRHPERWYDAAAAAIQPITTAIYAPFLDPGFDSLEYAVGMLNSNANREGEQTKSIGGLADALTLVDLKLKDLVLTTRRVMPRLITGQELLRLAGRARGGVVAPE